MKKGRKNCDEQLIEQISNTLEMLLEKGLLYTYNELKREQPFIGIFQFRR